MLKKRILTALILLAVFFGVVFSGSALLLKSLFAVCILLAAWEWAGLSRLSNKTGRTIYAVVNTMVFLILCQVTRHSDLMVYLTGVGWWGIATIMIIAFQSGKNILPGRMEIRLFVGLLVLLPAAISLTGLYEKTDGISLFVIFFILIWLVDSAAFFAGSKLGKHKLACNVSPGKSWEGFIAGLVMAAILVPLLVLTHVIADRHLYYLSVLFVLTAAFSVVGDLFESMLKRDVNIKDSSNLLPGHGGILDRIDSITSAAPIYMLGLWLLENKL